MKRVMLALVVALGFVACTSVPVPVAQDEQVAAWTWETEDVAEAIARDPASSGLVLNGPLEARGDVGNFKLKSELRLIPYPMKQNPLTYAGLKRNQIAITIDDGPSPENNAFVLKTLREHGVKATFFVVGWRSKKYPELVKAILKEGHSVASHSWDHPDFTKLGDAKAKSEIDDAAVVLQQIGEEAGYPIQPFFRFPYGAGMNNKSLKKILADRGLANFFWSMSMKDSETKDPNVALNTAVSMLDRFDHGLFLMHETHIAGVKALPYLLKELDRRGYTTVYYQAGHLKK